MQAVLLDGLGTLLELQPPSPLLESQLRDLHIEITPEQARRAFGAEIAYYVEHHLEGFDCESLAALRTRCAGVLHTALPAAVGDAISGAQLLAVMLDCLRFTVYSDVVSTLGRLRERGRALIIVSNWDISLHQVLRVTGLSELLDGAVTSAEVGQPKPGPAIFEQALDLAGVTARQAMHVGDSLANDVHGALAMGIKPVLLRRAGSTVSRVPAGTRAIDSLTELLA
jgi:putative hydrolase of the HAD superfamily